VASKICHRMTIEILFDERNELLTVNVDSHGTYKDDDKLREIVMGNFEWRFEEIRKLMSPIKPCLKRTAVFGHFSRSDYPWEIVKANIKL